jgi:purine nucleosidase
MQNIQADSLQKPVFLDMDGATDDLVSLITLMTLPNFRLTGVSVTNGNCYTSDAVESVLRIFNLFCRNDVEVAVSNAKAVNVFPTKWREKGKLINKLSIIKDTTPDYSRLNKEEASEFTARKLMSENEKSYVILSGPATNLFNTIEKYPEVKNKIEKIFWMAGAFFSNGNVISPDHDGSAEWNIFWDPVSARNLLFSGLKITLFPLDACYQVPVDNYLMYFLKKQSKYKLSKLVFRMLDLTYSNHPKFYMWDVLPSLFLGFPEIAHITNTSVDIELRGTSVGNIFKTSKGTPIHYATTIDEEKFYETFLHQLKQF